MASYIQGITDYIPQYQPFQPDYNFLGNVLQNAQTQYDANYKQLSKTYGTLLNSPMLREDNIKQRDEFFNMIDNDIKKISGMDLSLQQNVDAANAVFSSFYKNKEMVKDMVFTKEYQKQLQIGDNYRNCIDQEECGGKYWDTGAAALHFKADEFKKANRSDTLGMSVGRFVPMINMQEKAMKFTQELLGGKGGFGVQTVTMSPDGRYQITMKNGSLLEAPLQQFLYNQYSQDQAVQDMYNTSAYVQRKSFIANNIETFGSEDAAEDEYFRQADISFQNAQSIYKKDLENVDALDAKGKLLEKEIQNRGSNGEDDLAFDFEANLIDKNQAYTSLAESEKTYKIAKSMFEAGDNRQAKRQRVDMLLGRTLMQNDIFNSATAVAALTGEVSMEEDQYALAYYNHSLKMDEIRASNAANAQAKAQQLNEMNEAVEYQMRGSAESMSNVGTYQDATKGTTDPTPTPAYTKGMQQRTESINSVRGNHKETVQGYTNLLVDIINTPGMDPNEVTVAKNSLVKIYGKVERDVNGRVTRPGFDPDKKAFFDINNQPVTNANIVFNTLTRYKGLKGQDETYNKTVAEVDVYNKANKEIDSNRSIPAQRDFIRNTIKPLREQNIVLTKLMRIADNTWKENNLRVKSILISEGASEFLTEGALPQGGMIQSAIRGIMDLVPGVSFSDKVTGTDIKTGKQQDFINEMTMLFNNDGSIKSKSQYTKDYIEFVERNYGDMYIPLIGNVSDYVRENIDDIYTKNHDLYKYAYNKAGEEGRSIGGKPVVQELLGTNLFGGFEGGTTAGGSVTWEIDSQHPQSFSTQGLLTLNKDVIANPGKVIYSKGNLAVDMLDGNVTQDNVETYYEGNQDDIRSARLGYEQFMNDLKQSINDFEMELDEKTGQMKLVKFNEQDKKRVVLGQVSYSDVALGDDRYTGYEIKYSQEWLNQYKKKNENDEPTWADNLDGQSINVYLPKSASNNTFRKSFELQPYDVILDREPVTLSLPNAGSLTINKRNEDGTYTVGGYLYGYSNGQKIGLPVEQNIYSSETGGQNLYNSLNVWLNDINNMNTQLLETGNYWYRPDELPNVSNYLSNLAQAGGNQ